MKKRKKDPTRRYVLVTKSGALRQESISGSLWRDTYHFLMENSWPTLIGFLAFIYLVLNLIFAILFMLGGNCLGESDGSFSDSFYFSVQTLATIGFGHLYPKNGYANFIVTIEAFVGTLGTAVMTGLIFAKFSIPKAKVLFSKHVTITTHNGKKALKLRLANNRGNQLVEGRITVSVLMNETNSEGEFLRRIRDLQLDRNTTPVFVLSWLITHIIDESSPLYDLSADQFDKNDLQIIVSFVGLDDTSGQTMHARHLYRHRDVAWNARLADFFGTDSDGRRYLDYSKFHQIEPDKISSESSINP